MPAALFGDPDEEDRLIAQVEAARQARERYVLTEDLARRTAQIGRTTGTTTAAYAAAKGGLDVTSPAVQRIGKAQQKRKAKGIFGPLRTIGDLMKGTTRVSLTALETPLQELQGVIRGAGWGLVYQKEHGGNPLELMGKGIAQAGRSTGFKAVEDLVGGRKVDLGTGFFSGGQIREEQRRDSEQLLLNNKPITTGRVIADKVVEPGTRPYDIVSGLIDASVAIGADPINVAAGGVTKAVQARRLFVRDADEVAGLVKGTRKGVIPERVDAWLNGSKGQKVIEKVAETSNPYEVWRLLGRKVDPDVAVQLADAPDTAAVRSVLEPELGINIREKPTLTPVRTAIRRNTDSIRLLQTMPGRHFQIDDQAQAVNQMERLLRNAKMPEDVIKDRVSALMRAETPTQMYRVIVDETVPEIVQRIIPRNGRDKARKLTKLWKDSYAEMSGYFIDGHGMNVSQFSKKVTVNGVDIDLPTPHLVTEYLHNSIPSLDARALRRATAGRDWAGGTAWHKIVNSGAFDVTSNVLDFVSQDVWKPLALLRGAWTVRVVGEEQIRMAASGHSSLISHPLRAIAWATGRKGGTDVLGAGFDDAVEFQRSLSLRGSNWRDGLTIGKRRVYRDVDGVAEYAKGLRDEIGILANDPVGRRVAGGWSPGDRVPGGLTGNHVEDAKRWFWNGPGQKFRKEMAEASGRQDLLDQIGANEYIDSVFKRVEIKTSNDPRLLEAIATGKVGGTPINDRSALNTLRAIADEGAGPDVVLGDLTIAGRPTAGGKVGQYMNTVTEFMFTNLMSKETNYLSRSPTFRQNYYKRLEELIPFMDDAAKQAAIAGAEKAGVNVTRMQRMALRGAGDLSIDDADLIAKGFGLEQTKKLLYDVSEKSQWADIARVAMPFAEAWKEILTRWAAIGMERPVAIRRVQQTIEGARGAGWFSTDPATGEEVFNYPGSGWFMGAVAGVPAPLQGNVASLNLFSNNPFIPGFGPVVQLSVGKLIPDKPEWDSVRDLVTPYGEPSGPTWQALLPAWSKKWITAMSDPDSDRIFANTVMDVSRYLVSTGDYSTETVEEQERLSRAAVQKARLMYLIRGAAQYVAPAAPSPEFMAQDKAGNLVTAFKLTEEFRKLQEADYETAVQKFLDIYGEDALLYMQPKSRGGFSPTDELHEWVRENPELPDRYPDVFGFFAPSGGEFSMTEMERQIATGEREALTPDEAVELANHRVAAAKYRAAKERVGSKPSAKAKAWLREIRDALAEEYPGYNPEGVTLGKAEIQVRQLYDIVREPAVQKTPAGQALARYLAARDKAQAAAEAKGLATFGRAKAMRGTREWLRDIAAALTDEYPEFSELYDRVLDREMVDDAPQEVTDGV